jgi:spermidine synthase
MDWFYENLHANYRQSLRVDEMLYEGRTEFQSVQVFQNSWFGRVLVLDGIVQTTEFDEFVYHEMLTHVPLFALDRPRNVLIIGGGDGGCLEEVLKHPVEKAVMCELDQGVVDLSREYLPSICGDAFDDPRTELIIGDGAKYLAETDIKFDVIIIDSTDPIGPGEVLFSREFYADCRRCLSDQGILITQNGVLFLQPGELDTTRERFAGLFAHAGFYFAAVPSYTGGVMAFGCASNGTETGAVDVEVLRRRYAEAGIDTRYYTPEVHKAVFARPAFLDRPGGLHAPGRKA